MIVLKILVAILSVIAFLAIVILIAWYFTIKRRKQFKALGDRLGLEFEQEDAFDLIEEYSAMEAFSRGQDRRAYNQIFGEFKGRQVLLTDYTYVEDICDKKSSQAFTYCLILREKPLEPLRIRPEKLFDKIGVWSGFKDVDFQTESEEFNSAFYVSAEDEHFAREILTPELRDFLLQHKKLRVEICGDILLTHFGWTINTVRMEELLYLTLGIDERLPS